MKFSPSILGENPLFLIQHPFFVDLNGGFRLADPLERLERGMGPRDISCVSKKPKSRLFWVDLVVLFPVRNVGVFICYFYFL